MLKHKRLYVALGIVGALVVLAGTVGVAYAQGPQPPVDDCPCGCGDGGRMGGGPGWGMQGSSLVDATAEATGLPVDEVIAALQEGQTFAQIAEAQGVDPQAIVDAFLADRKAALEQAMADGRLTQEQADRMLEEMTEHVSERLAQAWSPRFFGDGRMGRGSLESGWDMPGRSNRQGAGRAPRFSQSQ